jgi:hypothetical protein
MLVFFANESLCFEVRPQMKHDKQKKKETRKRIEREREEQRKTRNVRNNRFGFGSATLICMKTVLMILNRFSYMLQK